MLVTFSSSQGYRKVTQKVTPKTPAQGGEIRACNLVTSFLAQIFFDMLRAPNGTKAYFQKIISVFRARKSYKRHFSPDTLGKPCNLSKVTTGYSFSLKQMSTCGFEVFEKVTTYKYKRLHLRRCL